MKSFTETPDGYDKSCMTRTLFERRFLKAPMGLTMKSEKGISLNGPSLRPMLMSLAIDCSTALDRATVDGQFLHIL